MQELANLSVQLNSGWFIVSAPLCEGQGHHALCQGLSALCKNHDDSDSEFYISLSCKDIKKSGDLGDPGLRKILQIVENSAEYQI